MRPVTATSVGVYGEGGIKKSALLTAVPAGVLTLMRPDVLLLGTLVVIVVLVAALIDE